MILLACPATRCSSTWRSRAVSVSTFALISRHAGLFLAVLTVEVQRFVQPREQHVVLERLLEQVDRAGAHPSRGDVHVGRAGEEDDRDPGIALAQLLLQLQPAHAGQGDIEQQTTGLLRAKRGQEFFGGPEPFGLDARAS